MDNTYIELELEEVACVRASIARDPSDPPLTVEGELVYFRCWNCKLIYYVRRSSHMASWKPSKNELCRQCHTPLFIGEGEE
jgi:hypothetical protein